MQREAAARMRERKGTRSRSLVNPLWPIRFRRSKNALETSGRLERPGQQRSTGSTGIVSWKSTMQAVCRRKACGAFASFSFASVQLEAMLPARSHCAATLP